MELRPIHGLPETPQAVVERLRAAGPSIVALSGGVDSGVVALLAHRALGTEARAVTLTGPSLPAEERAMAGAVARAIGIEHAEIPVDQLSREEYRSNPENRCYFCRQVETTAIRRLAAGVGITVLLDGVHLDDLGDIRPGLKAMDEAGFRHPLLEAGWRKSDVRECARSVGLPNWDRPSNACLASRVRHGESISAALLAAVDRAESAVRGFGFRRVRVRVSAGGARVVVGADEVERLIAPPTAQRVVDSLLTIGFSEVTLDPAGYAPRPGG
ncbi:MAG TPA: ATP-dependent sacrificial sulfur transferase LarE [Thermoplasmata archaeon]|nr:ATP-dependent sacrificial sulfur transferase LarE [Thermoplasmata archaeon]